MQNLNRNSNSNNNHYHVTKRLSPLGYGIIGIAGVVALLLFGRILLLLAVIGGIGWLAWKFRWAIQYYFNRFIGMVNSQSQAFQQKCRNNQHSQQYYSTQNANPFKTSGQYQPGQSASNGRPNTGAGAPAGRRNVIFDVTPGKGSR